MGGVPGAEKEFAVAADSAGKGFPFAGDEKGFSFAEGGVDQEKAASEGAGAAGFSVGGALKNEGAAVWGEEPGDTGDQKGLDGASEAPAPLTDGLVQAEPAGTAGVSGVAPRRGGRVTTESFRGVISAAKSSGQLW